MDRYVHLLWECAEGHHFRASPGNVGQGKWCRVCAGHVRRTLEDMHELAAEHEGRCLSRKYTNVDTKLLWQCHMGHRFRKIPSAVARGSWCPHCHGTVLDDLARLRMLAQQRGGECLSSRYLGTDGALRWQCRQGHVWDALPNRVVQGSWCPECASAGQGGRKHRLTIEDMHETAGSRGGECLSDVYVNSETPLRWRCANGHEWEARPSSIRYGKWCPVCANRSRGTLDGIRVLANERGGRLVSRSWNDHRKQLLVFECRQGHRFRALGKAVKSGMWCPECKGRKQ